MNDCARCGHTWEAHQHYRVGTDCTFCGRVRCAHYRSWRTPAQVLSGLMILPLLRRIARRGEEV
jgi:hypothetical protein